MVISKQGFSQRVLLSEGFETSGFNADSIPTGWFKAIVNNPPSNYPYAIWNVRDSGVNFQGVNALLHSRAHTFLRGLTIPWTAGNPIADQWMFTPVLNVQAGDSLIFWMLLGTPEDLSNFTEYIDTMQVHVCSDQDPALSIAKLATIRSLDSSNVWTAYKFDLSPYAGQSISLAFRYFMNTSDQGLWCNLDDIFVGNRTSVGISQNGSIVPEKFALNQNYPNPFNPTTKINFDLAKASNVKITVFNSVGQMVVNLFNGYKSAGSYQAEFDGNNLSSGTYYYKLETDFFTETKKMQLVK